MIKDASFDDINSLDDFGAIMAQSVVDFFSKEVADLPKGHIEVPSLVAVSAPYTNNFAFVYLINVIYDDQTV